MLVLTRRPDQAIVIDGDIRIVVLSSDRRGVRLGIEAPGHRAVVREELLQEVADANQRANDTSVDAELMPALTPLQQTPSRGA